MVNASPKRALVVAPHPDDEVLGVGGTIARLVRESCHVTVLIVTSATPERFGVGSLAMGRGEARRAHEVLGVQDSRFLEDVPAAEVDRISHADVNMAIASVVGETRPDWLFIPFLGDIHMDHQLVALSSMVAARPVHPDRPSRIYAYETLSETNWNAPYVAPGFHPTTFIDISATLETKIAAMQAYASQVRSFPDERSVEALRALATLRGATVSLPAAEAFVLLREIYE